MREGEGRTGSQKTPGIRRYLPGRAQIPGTLRFALTLQV